MRWPLLLAAAMAAAIAALPETAAPRAEEGEAETVRVEGIAERAPSDLAASCTVIRADEFSSRWMSVADLLGQAPGVVVRSLGGLGSFATVSIRGSTAEQVNVYVDGVLLNPSLGGGVDLSALSLGQIEAIEIYRGVTPAWLEGSGIGGAISIRTRRAAEEDSRYEGSLAYGSYDTMEAAASASWTRTGESGLPRDALISFTGMRTDGDFDFFDNNGTPIEGADDGYETRVNNEAWHATLLGRGGWTFASGSRFEVQADAMARRQGVPGIDAFQSETALSESWRGSARAAWTHDGLAGGTAKAELSYNFSLTRQELSDPGGDLTAGIASESGDTLVATGPSVVVRLHPDSSGSVRHRATLLASARLETADREDEALPQEDRGHARRLTLNASLEDEIQFLGGRLAAIPSLRWTGASSRFEIEDEPAGAESADTDESAWSGRIGLAWRPSQALVFRANAGRYHRLPSFTEIFGNQGAIRPGGSLEPERGSNYDAGVSWEAAQGPALSRLALQATLFLNQAEDLIQLVQTSQSQVTPQNTGHARIHGAELSFSAGIAGGWSGALDYTWQVAVDQSGGFTDGSDLPGRPRHELSARARLDRSWGRPFYELTYLGPYFVDAAAAALSGSPLDEDQLQVPERYLHTVGFTGRIGPHWEYTLEIDNAGDVQTVDLVRYPLPGRVARAKLRVTLP